MDLYLLDSLYRRQYVIDSFESLIWTERLYTVGDFELHIKSTPDTRTKFINGVNLAIPASYRVMTVESVEDSEGSLTVKGHSLENILDSRLAMSGFTNLNSTPKWVITGLPKDLANKIFHDICVTGVFNSGDIISGITEANVLFPVDTISPPASSITYEIDPKTVYQALSDLCKAYGMGFRIVRDPMSNQLYFDVYMGSNRTSKQSGLAAVVFSPALDNLQKTTELTSTAVYKNVAYVLSASPTVGSLVVYADGVSSTISSFDRRVLVVVANDITSSDGPTATAQMTQRGKNELAKYRQFKGFDGELNQFAKYKYQTDYFLGDLVELRNTDGITADLQVTEQIIVSDAQGDRSYPTLAANQYLTPGSWLAWDPTQVWNDLDTGVGLTTYWQDQP